MPHRAHDDRGPAGATASGFSAVWPPRRTATSRPLAIGLLAVALAICGGNTVPAELMVEGQADAVRLDATDAPLQDALDALQAKFNLRYRSRDSLDSHVTGNFNGPLRRVLARLLDGYDFAMIITPRRVGTPEGIDLVVLRQSPAGSIVIARAGPARAPAPPARVMSAQEANRYERSRSR